MGISNEIEIPGISYDFGSVLAQYRARFKEIGEVPKVSGLYQCGMSRLLGFHFPQLGQVAGKVSVSSVNVACGLKAAKS